MTVVVKGSAYLLTSPDGIKTDMREISELRSSQEETDTRIVLYAIKAAADNYKYVRVRSPDSDIFFILLHHAKDIWSKLYFDTGSGNNRRLLDISSLAKEYGEDKSEALMCLHALTGTDTTSAFKGIGKIKPLNVLLKNQHLEKAIRQIGDSWDIESEMLHILENFVCVLYGSSRVKSIDDWWLQLLNKKFDYGETLE